MSDRLLDGLSGLPDYSDPEIQIEMYAKTALSSNPGLNIGPLIIGAVVDLVLVGVACNQMVIYMSYPEHDRLFIRLIVYWVFTVALVASGFGIWYIWGLFVDGFGVYSNFLSWQTVCWYGMLDIMITAPVQVFYLKRAHRLWGRPKWILGLIIPLIIGAVVGGSGLTYVMRDEQDLRKTDRFTPWFYLWDGSILAADFALTSIIVSGLWQNKTGWSMTDKLVLRLIRTSVESQLPATIYAIGFLLQYSIDRTSQITYFWVLSHPKIYVVSLSAVLNFRTTLKAENEPSLNEFDDVEKDTEGRSRFISGLTRSDGAVSHPLDRIRVDTATHAETHSIPAVSVGVNRQPSAPSESLPREDDLPGQ